MRYGREEYALGPGILLAIACVTAASSPARATTINLPANPSFESGGFDGWIALGTSEEVDCSGLSVASTGDCGGADAPIFGSDAAFASAALMPMDTGDFDVLIEQRVMVPSAVTSAQFTWWQSGQWDLENSSAVIAVSGQLQDNFGGISMTQFSTTQNGSEPWTECIWDVTSFLHNKPSQWIYVGLNVDIADGGTGLIEATLGSDNFCVECDNRRHGSGCA